MKIIIVGAGISGLSTYLILQKHLPKPSPPAEPHSIIIYEAYNTAKQAARREVTFDGTQSANTLTIGGGLGVSPNGLKVLERIDPEIFHDVVRAGHPILEWKISNSWDWTLAHLSAKDYAMPGKTQMGAVMISRQGLWDCLRDRVPDEAIITKRISEVSTNATGRHVLKFADGSPEVVADLIIGADGLRSIVKRAIFGDGEKDSYPPHYEGLVGVGGFIPADWLLPSNPAGSMSFIFGPNGFFGLGHITSSPDAPNRHLPYDVIEPGDQAAWWSTYSIEECPDPRTIDKEDIRRQLKERHGDWKNPAVQKIIENVDVDLVWPTWITPELPTWERDGLVLVGDSAHALPPSSGQGACQALEDSETFSLLLAHYVKQGYRSPSSSQMATEKEAINLAAKNYVVMRQPRIKKILDQSRMMGDLKKNRGFISQCFVSLLIWLMGKMGGSLGFKSHTRQLVNYDVPAEVEKIIQADKQKEL